MEWRDVCSGATWTAAAIAAIILSWAFRIEWQEWRTRRKRPEINGRNGVPESTSSD